MLNFTEKSQGILFLTIFIISISTIIVSLSSCSKISAYQKSIFNDDSKIMKRGDSYTYITKIGNTTNQYVDIKFNGFTGKDSIWTISAIEDTYMEIDVESKIDSGDFKICLVSADKSVTTIVENSFSKKIKITLPVGESRICLVGNNSKGSLKINRTDSDSKISIKS